MIYLIHFDRPYKHARHYSGFTDDLERRLAEHRNGHGSRLLQVIKEAGIGWQLVRVWPGGRSTERRLKNWHNGPKLCPICNPAAAGAPAFACPAWAEVEEIPY